MVQSVLSRVFSVWFQIKLSTYKPLLHKISIADRLILLLPLIIESVSPVTSSSSLLNSMVLAIGPPNKIRSECSHCIVGVCCRSRSSKKTTRGIGAGRYLDSCQVIGMNEVTTPWFCCWRVNLFDCLVLPGLRSCWSVFSVWPANYKMGCSSVCFWFASHQLTPHRWSWHFQKMDALF